MLLDLKKLNAQYNMRLEGVIHIGGFTGEESEVYNDLDIKNVVFFEPIKRHCEILNNTIKNFNYPYQLIPLALGNKNQDIEINVSKKSNSGGSGASSSILKPKVHLKQYPNITFEHTEMVTMKRLDDLVFKENIVDINKFNMINIDVQGYELEVFKGAKKSLEQINYIIAEVNRAELYEDCAQIEELDKFLFSYDFERLKTSWDGVTWGDAFYKKKNI